MAHQSGYTGSIVFDSSETTLLFGPAAASMKVVSWSVDQRTKSFQAYAKSEDFVTTFGTVSEWVTTIEFLVQDAVTANSLEIREAGAVAKTVTYSATPGASFELKINSADYVKGAGVLTRLSFNDPLDGPVTATAEIAGNGALIATVA